MTTIKNQRKLNKEWYKSITVGHLKTASKLSKPIK